MRDTLKLAIEGMHCEGCVRRVTAVLQNVEGVELESVDVGAALVTFRPEQVDVEEIAAAVTRIGFTAWIEK